MNESDCYLHTCASTILFQHMHHMSTLCAFSLQLKTFPIIPIPVFPAYRDTHNPFVNTPKSIQVFRIHKGIKEEEAFKM